MVDCQCPGLGAWVRSAEAACASGEGWQARLMDELSRLWLLVRAARAQDRLPEPLRAEVRALLGYVAPKEHVLADGEKIVGTWSVAGQVVEPEGALVAQRTWLWDSAGHRPALLLDFAASGRALDVSLAVGTSFEGTLAYYPSAAPERALVVSRGEVSHAWPAATAGAAHWREALGRVADVLAQNPWRRRFPVALAGVRPVRDSGGRWWIVDAGGDGVPLSSRATGIWPLLAVSGGGPVTMFGEWDGERFLPLSAWTASQFSDLRAGRAAA